MKKTLRIIAILIGILVLASGIGAGVIQFGGIPKYDYTAPDLKVQADSAMIAEGKRFATMVCIQCHKGKDGRLSGGQVKDVPAMFGKAWAPNITQDPVYGIGKYTDGELAYLLRSGVKRDHTYAPPWMPKFPLLSDYDLHSIIAYLRSDAPELAPSKEVQPPSQPTFLAKLLARIVFKSLPYPTGPIEAPPVTDKVAFGKYLATAKVDCYGCHSPDFRTVDAMLPEKTEGYFSGGNPMLDEEGNVVYSRNITPDKETGIGNWTEEQFIQTIHTGIRDGKPAVRYPMRPIPELTTEEVSAIWAYLQSIPAVRHDIDSLAAAQTKI